jgi:hypothetical protein
MLRASLSVALLVLCGCSLHAILAEDALSLLQYGLQLQHSGITHTVAEEPASQRDRRLHVVSVTGLGKYENLSIIAQESWGKRLGATDNFTNICDVGCGDTAFQGRRLEHILPMPDSAFPSGRCTLNGKSCDGYQRAQFKFVWGFIHEYKQLASRGVPMPRWWFIKDDDTFVNIDRLMAFAANYDPNRPVLLSNISPFSAYSLSNWAMNGGSGWLASAAMAKELVLEHGDQWLKWQEAHDCEYDQGMPLIVDRVSDAEIVDMTGWFVSPRHGKHLAACPNRSLISLHMSQQWKGVAEDPYEMVRLSDLCFG